MNFIVLDVEGYSDARPYDVGYVVGNERGEIIERRSYGFLSPCWENIEKKIKRRKIKTLADANKMAHRNIQEIMSQKEESKYKIVLNEENFFKDLFFDLIKYNIVDIWAYNVQFDKGAIKRLNSGLFEKLDNKVNWCDIMSSIKPFVISYDYVVYCIKHNYLTEKGNCKTKAEVVYRYLFNDDDFTEEHTGLQDVFIEYRILFESIKKYGYKDIEKDKTVLWKLIKQFCEMEGIPIPSLADS